VKEEKAPKGGEGGITDGNSGNIFGEVSVPYTVVGFTATNATDGKSVKPALISIDIFSLSGGTNVLNNDGKDQPFSFTPDVAGNWEIRVNVPDLTQLIRIISVAASGFGVNPPPTADAGDPFSVPENSGRITLLDGENSTDTGGGTVVSYVWSFTGSGSPIFLFDNSTQTPEFDAPNVNGNNDRTLEFTLYVIDDGSAVSVVDTIDVTITQVP